MGRGIQIAAGGVKRLLRNSCVVISVVGLFGCATSENAAYQTSKFYITEANVPVVPSTEVFICSPGVGKASYFGKIMRLMDEGPIKDQVQIHALNYTVGFIEPGQSLNLRLPKKSHGLWFGVPYQNPSIKIQLDASSVKRLVITSTKTVKVEDELINATTYSRRWRVTQVSEREFALLCGDLPLKVVTHRDQVKKDFP